MWKKIYYRILCKLGIHKWKYYSNASMYSKEELILMTRRCGKTITTYNHLVPQRECTRCKKVQKHGLARFNGTFMNWKTITKL